jgi:hypothetical protein
LLKATGVHFSIITYITATELRGEVDRVSISNGLMNRFLYGAVKRARLLPRGGATDPKELIRIGEAMDEAIRAARLLDRVDMADDAIELWDATYPKLTADVAGLFGSLVARAEAHVVRLALVYALADQAQAIEREHLEAALEVWRYSQDSARLIFGALVGDRLADSLLVFLREARSVGMTSSELYRAVDKAYSGARIQAALELLLKQGWVSRGVRITPGRTGKAPVVWTYVPRRRP